MGALGPRARRRVATAAAVFAGLLVVVLALHHWTASSGPSTAPKQHEKAIPGQPQNLGVPYGASPAQVVRRLGQPHKRLSSGCWIYRVKNGAELIGDGFGQWVDAVKYCFGGGSGGGKEVTLIESHMVAHKVGKRLFPASWDHGGLTIMIPPEHPASP